MPRAFIETLMTKSTLRAFRHRNFVIVELASWLTGAGVWFYRIGLTVMAWELTHSGSPTVTTGWCWRGTCSSAS